MGIRTSFSPMGALPAGATVRTARYFRWSVQRNAFREDIKPQSVQISRFVLRNDGFEIPWPDGSKCVSYKFIGVGSEQVFDNNERVDRVLDGSVDTKMCLINVGSAGWDPDTPPNDEDAEFVFETPDLVTFDGYALYTANDCIVDPNDKTGTGSRHPTDWTLDISTDGADWRRFDTVRDYLFLGDPSKTHRAVIDRANGTIVQPSEGSVPVYKTKFYVNGPSKLLKPELPDGVSIVAVDGSEYGFTPNADGYYESQNQGVDYSYAICQVNIDDNSAGKTLYLDCICYAESYYDYGVIGNINQSLSLSPDEYNSVLHSFRGQQSPEVQSINCGVPSSGDFIQVKYMKDSSVSNNNDSIQFMPRWA